jgi:integrase
MIEGTTLEEGSERFGSAPAPVEVVIRTAIVYIVFRRRVPHLTSQRRFRCPMATNFPGREVKTFSRHILRKRFRNACKVLGAACVFTLTIHHGRHKFISHALAGGRALAEVRDAAGHCNVRITSGYLHVAVEDGEVGNLFG